MAPDTATHESEQHTQLRADGDIHNTGTLADLAPSRADLALIALPDDQVAAALEVTGRIRCRAALVLSSGLPAAPCAELLAIAQEYLEAGRPEAAGRMARHILAAAPDAPDARLLAGLAAFHAGRPEEAGDLVARAAPLAGTAAAWRSLAEIRRTQARLEEALGAARHANNTMAWSIVLPLTTGEGKKRVAPWLNAKCAQHYLVAQ
jgi:tetratricopeptide (TPR) repeat protein